MTRHPVAMVAAREIKARMLTKANIISLAIMLLVILVGAVILSFVLDRDGDTPTSRIALDPSVTALVPYLEQAATEHEADLDLTTVAESDAEAALTADDADRPQAHLSGDPASPEMLVQHSPDGLTRSIADAAVRSYVITDHIGALGGDPDAFGAAITAATTQVRSVEPPPDEDAMYGPAYGISMAAIALLLFALVTTGTAISMGVVEEKTSRVVEILLATIKPSQLLAGKVLGTGVYGLFQVAVIGGALVTAMTALGLTDDIDVSVGTTLLLLIVWFLLGYAIYALLFGGFAALVSRQEEIGAVTTPLMFLLLTPFYLTMFMVPGDPDGTTVRALSFVPLFAPFLMPVREAFGAVTALEMAGSMLVTVATIPLLIWVAGRVYARGVLHTGGRMKLSAALKG